MAMDAFVLATLVLALPASHRPSFPEQKPTGGKAARAMRYADAVNIEDLHQIAKRKLPRIIFDYIEGGVEDEHGLVRNGGAFQRHQLLPRYLVDVSKRDQSTTLFGHKFSGPFGISPTGSVALYQRRGGELLFRSGGGGPEHSVCHVGRCQLFDGR